MQNKKQKEPSWVLKDAFCQLGQNNLGIVRAPCLFIQVSFNVLNDVFGSCARTEYFFNPVGFEASHILFRNYAASKDKHVIDTFFLEKLPYLREKIVVGPRE